KATTRLGGSSNVISLSAFSIVTGKPSTSSFESLFASDFSSFAFSPQLAKTAEVITNRHNSKKRVALFIHFPSLSSFVSILLINHDLFFCVAPLYIGLKGDMYLSSFRMGYNTCMNWKDLSQNRFRRRFFRCSRSSNLSMIHNIKPVAITWGNI